MIENVVRCLCRRHTRHNANKCCSRGPSMQRSGGGAGRSRVRHTSTRKPLALSSTIFNVNVAKSGSYSGGRAASAGRKGKVPASFSLACGDTPRRQPCSAPHVLPSPQPSLKRTEQIFGRVQLGQHANCGQELCALEFKARQAHGDEI